AHQQALARKMREARPHAKQGDIFSSDARESFHRSIRKTMNSPRGKHARATLKQGDPLPPLRLRVNDVYPDKLPFTTVPPTLLQVLPKLPNELVYRIVGRDLLLVDMHANMIVDVMHEAMPRSFVPNPGI